jgi:large subunit ribosomal protein L32
MSKLWTQTVLHARQMSGLLALPIDALRASGMAMPALALGLQGHMRHSSPDNVTHSWLGSIWTMAVPKSKISRSRKRMKWKQHIPEPIAWYKCNRCGEPKRHHRICTKHADICAMRDEEYSSHMEKQATSAAE